MTNILVHSQNLRGSLKEELLTMISSLLNQDCECTAIFLQDIGLTGPEGPPILKNILGDHKLFVNFSPINKARTVAIILHKAWNVQRIMRDETGSLVGALITKGCLKVLIISAYLPAALDNYGIPAMWRATDTSQCSIIQQEAHSLYCTLQEWTNNETYWIVGGDMNEVRAQIDRKRIGKHTVKPNKFISHFLEETEGVDIWRTLFPSKPGYTHRDDRYKSFSRIDYFIASKSLFDQTKTTNMSICNWESSKDHARIILSLVLRQYSENSSEQYGTAWSIPQPKLWNLTSAQRLACKLEANQVLQRTQEDFELALQSTDQKLACADFFSKLVASQVVKAVGSIVGMKRPTHRKGKYQSLDVTKAKAEITTIAKARDLIRKLYLDEVRSDQERNETWVHLQVLLDRLCRMDLPIPTSFTIPSLHEWSESWAPFHIQNISNYLRSRKEDMISEEKRKCQELFLNPTSRGRWFQRLFGTKTSGSCPNFAIDSKTGARTTDPDEVKEIYLREGAHFLRNKMDRPGDFREEDYITPEPPPDPQFRPSLPEKKNPDATKMVEGNV